MATPGKDARQGETRKNRPVTRILVASLVLAAIAFVIVWYLF